MSSSQHAGRVIIVTGLSGSGKSIAIRQLEDSGYYCIDNLPSDFLSSVVRDLSGHGCERIAISVDARSQLNLSAAQLELQGLKAEGYDVRVLFLTASTPELVQRFSETRRRHPLTIVNGSTLSLSEAIGREREILEPVAQISFVIDTTRMLPNTLRDAVQEFAEIETSNMMLAFESFAFKHGIPVVADLVFDVRNLPNPYYDRALRDLTGLDAPVAEFLNRSETAQRMIDDIAGFLSRWISSYEAQNRHYLTIAIGCTGGQHRSVYVAERLAALFRPRMMTVVRHRQLARKGLLKPQSALQGDGAAVGSSS